MSQCEVTQNALADFGGDRTALSEELRLHLENCTGCQATEAHLQEVEAALADMEAPDAPDALVAETLAAVREVAQTGGAPAGTGFSRPYLAGGLAASLAVAAALGLTFTNLDWTGSRGGQIVMQKQHDLQSKEQIALAPDTSLGGPKDSTEGARRGLSDVEDGRAGGGGAADSLGDAFVQLRQFESKNEEGEYRGDRDNKADDAAELDVIARLEGQLSGSTREARNAEPPEDVGAKRKASKKGSVLSESETGEVFANNRSEPSADRDYNFSLPSEEQVLADLPFAETETVAPVGQEQNMPLSIVTGNQSAADAPRERTSIIGGLVEGEEAQEPRLQELSKVGADEEVGATTFADSNLESGQTQARNFLELTQSPDGLTFKEPRGYWANTYIPGDPAMRLLQARLQQQEQAGPGQDLMVNEAVRPVSQPFDAPENAAMALYLDTDRPVVDGPTRLRLQVGLKGADRQGGHRPAMNVGLLLDLRAGVSAETGAKVRALVKALERARNPEDRFSLIVAGPGGGLLVGPDDFRHGPLEVALETILEAPNSEASEGLALSQALEEAYATVWAGDNPNEILGSSTVLLVTGESLAGELRDLERRAYENAIAGVPLSVIGLGTREELSEIDRLVAVGQGNRRILGSLQQTESLIDRELHAASRAVARALRLSIRLPHDVELIDVIGSRRLGEAKAEQVRQAEQAIDQRLARNLGITADRGEDEDGIQIVIPNFYAGDSHVILLDLLVHKPGPLAEVTLRYKDVVQLRNATAQASLSTQSSTTGTGPLNTNVLKNLVAWEFSQRVRLAAAALLHGEWQEAKTILTGLAQLIEGLRQEVPGWSSDPDLAADVALIKAFLLKLEQRAVASPSGQAYLSDSLRYTAYRKLQTAAR